MAEIKFTWQENCNFDNHCAYSFDIILYISLVYLLYDISATWSSYSDCSYPLNTWLLVTYILVGVLRFWFLFYQASKNCVKFAAYVMMIIFFPITLVWTIIGTIWYSILSNMGALHCVKESDGSKPWLIIFWLAIMFFISLIFLLGVIASCLESLKHYLGADFFLSDEQMENLIYENNAPGLLDQNQDEDANGLTRRELKQLRTKKFEPQKMKQLTDGTCPICFSEFQKGQKIRDLQTCDHLFHKKCIDQWLRLNANCPLCRGDIRDSIDRSMSNNSENLLL